jgi:hypothetical protein
MLGTNIIFLKTKLTKFTPTFAFIYTRSSTRGYLGLMFRHCDCLCFVRSLVDMRLILLVTQELVLWVEFWEAEGVGFWELPERPWVPQLWAQLYSTL